MVKTPIKGPLVAMAIADAYGAGFEFVPGPVVLEHNNMEGYVAHPTFKRPVGAYTDDTQMALALAEHLLSDDPWTPLNLANRWVQAFKRDPHTGYAKGFHAFLLEVKDGADFLARISPHSTKNGAMMRAFPCGYLYNPREVVDKAFFQASLTHATYIGCMSAAAVALAFHFLYHCRGQVQEIPEFLGTYLPGFESLLGESKDPTSGTHTLNLVLGVLLNRHSTLSDVIQEAVSFGGDTDTVAAIAAALYAVSQNKTWAPKNLYSGLENGAFGRNHLVSLDLGLRAKYQPWYSLTKKQKQALYFL